MSQEGATWATGAIIVISALLLTAAVIGGLVVVGGVDWLIPGGVPQSAVTVEGDDKNLGLAEYVDRTLLLDRDGRLSIDGVEYDNIGLHNYLERLLEGGGVHLVLRVDSDGPSERRLAVENICERLTGLKPELQYAVGVPSPHKEEDDGLDTDVKRDPQSDLTAP